MILVAGGSGMLGIALQNLFKARGTAFRAVSRRAQAGCEAFDLSEERDVKALFREKYDCVIHSAAWSDVDGCEREPGKAHAGNALTTKYLAAACAANGTPLVYVSTDYVFDGRKRTPYETDDRTGPVNVYGMTKLAGEFYAKQCPASAIVRTSWLFGPGNPANFVDAVKRRLAAEPRVAVLRDQTDSPTYTHDLAAAIDVVCGFLMKEKPGDCRTFHFCNKGETTRFKMAEKIRDLMGLEGVEVAHTGAIPNRPAIRPVYGVLATDAYEKFFGVGIRGWEEGLREYVRSSGDVCVS